MSLDDPQILFSFLPWYFTTIFCVKLSIWSCITYEYSTLEGSTMSLISTQEAFLPAIFFFWGEKWIKGHQNKVIKIFFTIHIWDTVFWNTIMFCYCFCHGKYFYHFPQLMMRSFNHIWPKSCYFFNLIYLAMSFWCLPCSVGVKCALLLAH